MKNEWKTRLVGWFICTLCFVAAPLKAATEFAHFIHYSTEDGLLSNLVWSLTTDNDGHLWAGTDCGLERFDGKRFKHYSKKDYPALQIDEVQYVQRLADGRMALSSWNGVFTYFDVDRDTIYSMMPVTENGNNVHVRRVYSSDSRNYLLTNSEGIYAYDEKQKKYVQEAANVPELSHALIGGFHIDKKGRKWVGTAESVQIYSSEWKLLKQFGFQEKKGSIVSAFTPLQNGKMLVSTYSNLLLVFDTNEDEIAEPRHIRLPFDNATNVHKDRSGRYWMMTDGDGLWYTDDMDSEHLEFTEIRPYTAQNNEISKIYALTEDAKGNIWIGTYNSGIWGYIRNQNESVYYSGQKGFPSVMCSGFASDDNGNLWISSDGNGLYKVNTNFQRIERITLPSANMLSMGVSAHNSNDLIIATWGHGALKYNIRTGACEKMRFPGIDVTNDYDIVVCRYKGKDCVGTTGDGFYVENDGHWSRLAPGGHKNSPYPNLWTRKIVDGLNGVVWIATSSTIWRCQGDEQEALLPDLAKQHELKPLLVNDIVVARSGELYAATTAGVLRISEDGKKIDKLHFLPVTNYPIILEDLNGYIWVAGAEGVYSFNPTNESYMKRIGPYTDNTRHRFSLRAGYVDQKGRLYFGSNAGFLCFNPNDTYDQSPITCFSFSNLMIDHEKVKPYSGILKDGKLSSLNSIELAHGQTNISVEVDLVDFDELNQAKCRYRLIGLHEDWQELDLGKIISFNHLPKGEYTLQAQAFRFNDNSPKKSITLQIIVLPPWWATWWFRTLLFLITCGFIGVIIWRRMKSLEESQVKLTEVVNSRTKDLQNALNEKNRLISVVAHDMKNPMFAIVSSLGNWISKNGVTCNEDQIRPVKEIYASASTLQMEMEKLLEWVQSDKMAQNWNPVPVDLASVARGVHQLLGKQAIMKGVSIKSDFSLSRCAIADMRSVEIIIRNLVSNSIKFTKRGGCVSISGKEVNGEALIEVSDNGVGMKSDQLKQLMQICSHESTLGTDREPGSGMGVEICQIFVQRNGGVLHINSKAGVGTSISFTLPLSETPSQGMDRSELTPDGHIYDDKVTIETDMLTGSTLLLVDDDELLRNSLRDQLSKHMKVLTAVNGAEALEIINEQNVDLVVSDVSMPVMNGQELAHKLQEGKNTAHIPFLFISANNEDKDRLECLKTGAMDYICKPFNLNELLMKLNNRMKFRQYLQKEAMRRMMEEGGMKRLGNPAENVSADGNQEAEDQMAPELQKVMELLEEHYADYNLQIDDIAKMMGISQSTLSRRVKSLSGKTPVELLSVFRLSKAKSMILECKASGKVVSIGDIAIKAGFTDPSYFTRRFKEYYGKTPSQIMERE